MCSLCFENNLLTIEGVRFAPISKKTPLSKLSFAFVSLALPLLVEINPYTGVVLRNFLLSTSIVYCPSVVTMRPCHSVSGYIGLGAFVHGTYHRRYCTFHLINRQMNGASRGPIRQRTHRPKKIVSFRDATVGDTLYHCSSY